MIDQRVSEGIKINLLEMRHIQQYILVVKKFNCKVVPLCIEREKIILKSKFLLP